MKTEQSLSKSISLLALATAALLMIPLIAMQLTNEVSWTLTDFVFAGTLLFGTGLAYKLITRKSSSLIYRFATGLALFSGFFLIWANLAVGIVGSEDNPANLMYFAVIAVGLTSAFVWGVKPRGMFRTMLSMAVTQVLIAIVILALGLYQVPPSSVVKIVGINGLFVTLYAISALLYKKTWEREVES